MMVSTDDEIESAGMKEKVCQEHVAEQTTEHTEEPSSIDKLSVSINPPTPVENKTAREPEDCDSDGSVEIMTEPYQSNQKTCVPVSSNSIPSNGSEVHVADAKFQSVTTGQNRNVPFTKYSATTFGTPGLAFQPFGNPFGSSLTRTASFGAPSFPTKSSAFLKAFSSVKTSDSIKDKPAEKPKWLGEFIGEGSAFAKLEPTGNVKSWMNLSTPAVLKPATVDLAGKPVVKASEGIADCSKFQLVPPDTSTFHPFPRLPPELRNMIWNLIVPSGKRIVRLYPAKRLLDPPRIGLFPPNYTLDTCHPLYKEQLVKRDFLKLCSSQPNPMGLYINKESRSYTKQFFKKIFDGSECLGQRAIWIRPDLDQLIFSVSCFEYNMTTAITREDRYKIEALDFFVNSFNVTDGRLVSPDEAEEYTEYRMEVITESTRQFPNLTRINLWQDGCYNYPHNTSVANENWRSLHPPLPPTICVQQIPRNGTYTNLNHYGAEFY